MTAVAMDAVGTKLFSPEKSKRAEILYKSIVSEVRKFSPHILIIFVAQAESVHSVVVTR